MALIGPFRIVLSGQTSFRFKVALGDKDFNMPAVSEAEFAKKSTKHSMD